MRIIPDKKFLHKPCSYVGTGCAYEDIYNKPFNAPLPEGLQPDGYLSLNDENKYIRGLLEVDKKIYYNRVNRVPLKFFLKDNDKRACVCVYGHFIYVNGHDYWSFFDNEDDLVVCIWYLK